MRLERNGCELAVRSAWRRRVVAHAEAEGDAPSSLAAALGRLRAAGLAALPRQARLLVPDELAYCAVLPADRPWREARDRAREHFAQALGRAVRDVAVLPLPGARHWFAATVDARDVDAWRAMLAGAGIELVHAEPALLDDLRALAPVVADEALLALVREEGVSVARIEAGALVELRWERCDVDSHRCLEQRVAAAAQTVPAGREVMVVCRSERERAAWGTIASGHRWRLACRPGLQGAAA